MLPAITFYQQYLNQLFLHEKISFTLNTSAFEVLNAQFKRFESPQANRYFEAISSQLSTIQALELLKPWRKGPFQFGEVILDAEWRCDQKWERVMALLRHAESELLFKNKRILDIGCGNGYYMFQMLEHDPELVVGIDPSALYFFQFQLMRRFYPKGDVFFLPIGWQDLSVFLNPFDVVFCMGVLYHHPDPKQLLNELKNCLASEGILILETLVIDGDDQRVLSPHPDRYACMPNVYHIPTVSLLKQWCLDAGFSEVCVGDVVQTTSDEQRVTPWGPQKSLRDFLDETGQKTIEGFPAPKRIVLSASLF